MQVAMCVWPHQSNMLMPQWIEKVNCIDSQMHTHTLANRQWPRRWIKTLGETVKWNILDMFMVVAFTSACAVSNTHSTRKKEALAWLLAGMSRHHRSLVKNWSYLIFSPSFSLLIFHIWKKKRSFYPFIFFFLSFWCACKFMQTATFTCSEHWLERHESHAHDRSALFLFLLLLSSYCT